jgi:glutathione S-transferase
VRGCELATDGFATVRVSALVPVPIHSCIGLAAHVSRAATDELFPRAPDMPMLYDYPLSGNCYKVRLLLSFLALDHEIRSVDFFPGREHKSAQLLALNPHGQLPILRDGDLVLPDSAAILVYLARRYDAGASWYPHEDAVQLGMTSRWLAFADSITATASAARLHDMLNYRLDVESARAGAHALFRIMDDHLVEQRARGCQWLVGRTPTIADVACFPYTALAGDGGIDTARYDGIGMWMAAFKHLDGFVTMPGVHPHLPDTPQRRDVPAR